MSFPWIAYSVELLDVWRVHISPMQHILNSVASTPYVREGRGCYMYFKFIYKFEMHMIWSYSLFEQELYQTELFLRWNVSFFMHLSFVIKVIGSRGIKFSLLLPQLCLLKTFECAHWFPVVQMSLEQHAGTLQSPVILSTHQSGFQAPHNALPLLSSPPSLPLSWPSLAALEGKTKGFPRGKF